MSLAAFRRQVIEQFAPAEPRRELTVDEYLRHSPGMPREAAEYQVAQHNRHADPAWRLRHELPDVEDVAHLTRLSPEEVFVRWLDGRSPRRQIEQLLADRGLSRAGAAEVLEHQLAHPGYEPIGVVADGDRVAHVLYRYGLDATDEPQPPQPDAVAVTPPEEVELARDLAGRDHPMVTTCRRQPDGTWRLIADHGFLRLGSFSICFAEEPSDEPADDAR